VEAMGYNGIWERWLRAYGGLDHPNMLGGVLSIALLLIVLYIDNRPERISHAPISNFQFPISKTLILFSVYCFLFTSLFFTFSRGAWASLVVGLIAVLAILLWQKNEKAMKRALELIFVGFALVILLFSMYSNLVLTRLSKDTRLEIKSNTERLESYKYAKEIIKEHWLFGVGIGNYTLALKNENKSPNPLYQGGKRPSYFYQPVHNTFLLVWAETGIFGLAGFLGLMLCVMCYVLCERKNDEKASCAILSFSVLFALATMMLVDHWYWSLHFGVLFFWLVLGLVALDFSDKECYNNQVMSSKNNQ
jgi:O-antigen ligase